MPPNVRPLSPELQEKARVELFEDPKKLEDSIQILKDWISKQPHLRARTDDQWLATFLRGCKFSVERTKEKLDLYYSLKNHLADLRPIGINDPRLKEIIKLGITLVLPKTVAPDSPRVILVRGGKYDPKQYSMIEVMSVSHYIQTIMYLEDDNFVVAGGVNVMDFEGGSMSHLSGITPSMVKKITVISQDAAPIRMKAAHHINLIPGFDTLLNMFKSLMNEKYKKRIHFHKAFETLYEHVPKEILPAEYGGNGGSVDEITNYWVNKVEEYRSWFEENEKYGTDESKRPGKPKTAEDMFGIEGSFRQLQFD